jgi:ribonuclease D
MLAAQLVEGEARSLVALAEKYIGVELTKQGRRSDWSRRPLTERQLAYAANDTRYLEEIAGKMERELERLGRLDWHRQSCRRMIKATGQDKPEPDPNRVWRIKGLSGMDRRQLAFVRAIWYWRDAEARRVDVPPFKVMGNNLIIELTEFVSTRRGRRLENGPKLPRNCVGRRLEKLKKAIQSVRAMAEDDYPDFLRGGAYTVPEYGPALDQLRAACDLKARELGLESSLIASKKQLETIVLARPTTRKQLQSVGHLMDWQADILAPIVKRIMAQL